MVGDSIEELHTFAEAIGVKRCWFHKDHYDLNPKNYEIVVSHDVQRVSSKEIVQIRKRVKDETTKRTRS